MKSSNGIRLLTTLVFVLACTSSFAGNGHCKTWFVQSGGTGDGNNSSPLGSLAEAEAVSAPCDTIVVLPSSEPLDGGIVLKDGQRLVGKGNIPSTDLEANPFSGQYSLIANSTGTGADGHAVKCLGTCSVDRIWITQAFQAGIYAIGMVGDLDVRRSRVSHYNASGNTFDYANGFPLGYTGIGYKSDANGKVVVRDTLVEYGQGTGISIDSLGTAKVQSLVQSVTVRGVFANVFAVHGIAQLASEHSEHHAVLRDSIVENVVSNLYSTGVYIASRGLSGSEVIATIERNVVSGIGGYAIWLVTLPDGPNQGSAIVKHNVTSDSQVGIIGTFQSDSAPKTDKFMVTHNTVEVGRYLSRGIEIIVGDHLDPRPQGHRGEWLIGHNAVTVLGPSAFANGIEIAYESSLNSYNSGFAEHNTIVGGPNAVNSAGIQLAASSELGRKATGDVVVRNNKIQMSAPNGVGMSWAAVTGFVTGPDVIPDWDIGFLYEKNCVQDTVVGFMVVDAFGKGFSNESYDLGGGDLGSAGLNNFIRTAVDIMFQPGIGIPPLLPPFGPPTVPDAPIIAENNYWDANNFSAVDPLEAFVLDLVGGGVADTEPYLISGPTDCGFHQAGDDD